MDGMGWMVIIGGRFSKSTFGANNPSKANTCVNHEKHSLVLIVSVVFELIHFLVHVKISRF